MESGEPGGIPGGVARVGPALVVARPGLWERLGRSARVTVVSAPAGSGKTVLLRSWLSAAGLTENAAWVSLLPDERDPQRFWLSVVGALRGTAPGSALVQELTAAPDLVDGWAIVERLLANLAPLQDPIWLVIDDVHELGQDQALRQLELFMMRAPAQVRFVLAARRDVRLGLHRLRLEGELSEIRGDELRFSLDEAAELFAATGLELPEPAVAMLHERTEGWAAGLRLAALAATSHPEPERFASGFSGTERTVAEYLLAEVLERQDERVRRLLLRTSVLERVNGELATLLTGDEDAERVLQDLEAANAFVVSLDNERTWFRYHQLFAALLRLELRRSEPGAVSGLHEEAARWLAAHGYTTDAIRHAQAAGHWGRAVRLLSDHWPALYLDGQTATVHELLTGFPPEVRAADSELATLAAADELARGSLEGAERYLRLAERGSVPADRRAQFDVLLSLVRLLHARQRVNPEEVARETKQLEAAAATPDGTFGRLGADLRTLALVSLGSAETWTTRYDQAHRHLERGVELARAVRRPYLEFIGLANVAVAEFAGPVALTRDIERPFARAAEQCRRAVELAEEHGWTAEPAAALAYRTLGSVLAWQGRPEEAEGWIQRAERSVTAEADPAAAVGVGLARATLEAVRARYREALDAARGVERVAGRMVAPGVIVGRARACQAVSLLGLGEVDAAGEALDGVEEADRQRGELRIATAAVALARDDPPAALTALAPVLDGSSAIFPWGWLVHAYLLEALARDALGDQRAVEVALERALELAEPDGVVFWFLVHPAPDLLERHARTRTAHASLLAEILSLLGGRALGPPALERPLFEPLSESELRVLRYLPTNLSAPEIARELYVSTNTVKTHIRNLYGKLDTHRRAEAVESARALGLLAPSAASKPARAIRASV